MPTQRFRAQAKAAAKARGLQGEKVVRLKITTIVCFMMV
jgi:hypothetical protein